MFDVRLFSVRCSFFHFPGLVSRTLKHLRCLFQDPFWKPNDGIDDQKSNDPEQQRGQYKKPETVFDEINGFKGPLIGIRINPQSKFQKELQAELVTGHIL